MIGRDITRLQTRLSGSRTMKRRPDMLFIIDVGREESAVREANLLNIPIVALVDTNANPQNVDYVIPSNDDAIRAIKLLVAKIADAVIEGKAMRKEEEPEQPSAEAKGDARKSRGTRKPVVETEQDDKGDEVLLGESTLAKMNVTRKPEEAAAPAAAVKEEPAAPAAE
jgi:small subunit ribosomal protein S2